MHQNTKQVKILTTNNVKDSKAFFFPTVQSSLLPQLTDSVDIAFQAFLDTR
jgi:hypothetical protein